eukprot:3884616-Rhodomonas_salina.2
MEWTSGTALAAEAGGTAQCAQTPAVFGGLCERSQAAVAPLACFGSEEAWEAGASGGRPRWRFRSCFGCEG